MNRPGRRLSGKHSRPVTRKIKRALDLAITEADCNRLAAEANERFLQSGIEIKDVYGKLEV
jgi:hypothetical protein